MSNPGGDTAYGEIQWPSYLDWIQMNTQWTCPICDTVNDDGYGVTAEPMCHECYQQPGWDWILQDKNTVLPICLEKDENNEPTD